jgi:rhodanese-related sulfurtransferase
MKKIYVYALGLAVLSSQFVLSQPAQTQQTAKSANPAKNGYRSGYREIHTDELAAFLRAHPEAVLVDARSREYDDGKRIGNAKHIPYYSSDEEITKALPDKNALLVVYCINVRCPASQYLVDKLVELQYKNIVKYPEGLEEWIEKGHPVNETAVAQKENYSDVKVEKAGK